MAIITIAQRNELIALVTGMFNAAPGANYLGQLATLLGSGATLADIARTLAARSEFAQVYSPTLSVDDFAARLATNLLGNEVSPATKKWAVSWVKARLTSGEDRAVVISTAVQALHASTGADFAKARTMLQNKVELAYYYSVSKGYSSTSLAELQKLIADVTSEAPSVILRKVLVDHIAFDPAGSPYMLTSGVDAIVGSTSDDKIYSYITSGLSVGDSIDGAAGNDVLHIHDYKQISIPSSVAIKNVETVSLFAPLGVSGDVSMWAGLTALKITTMAGNIAVKAASTTNVDIVAGKVSGITIIPEVVVDVSGGAAISVISDSSVTTTIINPHAGLTLAFGLMGAVTFGPPKVSLTGNATLQDYLDAATAGSATTVRWFQYQGDTYVVQDNSASSTYVSGADATVKLVGLIDLNTATFTAMPGNSVSFTLN